MIEVRTRGNHTKKVVKYRESRDSTEQNFEILKNSDVLVGTPASWFFRISMLLRPYDKIKDVLYAENLSNIPGYPETYWHC